MKAKMSLLDAMRIQLECKYLSELRSLDRWQRKRLVRELEAIHPRAADLRDWNDALGYLTGQPPQPSAASAKAALIEALSAQ